MYTSINITFVFILLAVLTGCSSEDKHELTAELSMPYIKECTDTIRRAKAYHDSTFQRALGYIDLKIKRFDQTIIEDFGIDGVLTIKAYGDLRLLNGVTPEYYIRGISDSIASECMPDVSVSFVNDRTVNEYEAIKSRYGNPVLPVIKNGKVFIYYNRKDQRIKHW